jgi:translation initiation factor 5
MINVNNSNDEFYRYKMNKVSITNKGFGNGLFTIINNVEDICKSINTPPDILYKYISTDLGSNFNEKKKSINGTHTQEKIQESIYSYINDFVICKMCGIPEINYTINNNFIESRCSACGLLNEIKNNNKINQKIIDIIFKYLQKNKIWVQNKVNMVLQKPAFLNNFDPEEFGKEVDKIIEKEGDIIDDFNPFI